MWYKLGLTCKSIWQLLRIGWGQLLKATSTTAASDGVAETHAFGEHTGEGREVRWTLIWERPCGIAEPIASRVFGQFSQPHLPWSRCSRQPLRVLKAEKAQHISIPAPLRNANSREISSSASRSVPREEGATALLIPANPFHVCLQSGLLLTETWTACNAPDVQKEQPFLLLS